MRLLLWTALALVALLLCGCDSAVDNGGDTNQAPPVPIIDLTQNVPPNGSSGQPVTPTLRWMCIDPDGDVLRYDLYLGTSNPPPLLLEDTSGNAYVPDSLEFDRQYYWQVVARDGGGLMSVSPIWSFRTAGPPPDLQATPSVLDFGTGESSLFVTLRNNGSGDLIWRAGANQPWLDLTPTSGVLGEADQTIEVSADRTGLPPGDYAGAVLVLTDTDTVSVAVAMSIPTIPTLAITPTLLDFDSTKTQLSFELFNTGTGSLTYGVQEDISWLTVSPDTGVVATDTADILVEIDRTGVAPGNYTGDIIVVSDGGQDTVAVSMSVPTEPVLAVSPRSLDFDSGKTSISFEISNSGTGSVSWSASASRTWIDIDPGDGEVSLGSQKVTVTVDRTGLAPGDYNGSVNIVSNGGNESVSVAMVVPTEPVLSVTPTALDFDSSLTQLTFDISNSGTGTVSYTLSDDADWVTLSETSGSVTTGSDVITVTIDRAGLTPGDYTASVSVTSNGGDETVKVSMSVPTEPALLVEPTALDFDSTQSELTVDITNSGTGSVAYKLAEDADWLTLSEVSGSVTSDTATITFTVDRSVLAPGDYSTDVSVTSNGGDETVKVSMSVPTEPALLVEPTALDFDSTQSELTFEISNSGTGSVSYTLSDDADWLVLSQESGSVAVDTNAITVTIDRTGLTPGDYTASVSVTSNGGDETVSVDMVVPTEPVILVEPLSLDFDSTQSELTVDITNSGTGSVAYELAEDADWLTLSEVSGSVTTDTATITFTVDRSGLAPGDYSTDVSVTSNGGDETVSVDMVVPTVPVVLVDPLSLDFDSTQSELTFEISNSGTGTVSYTLSDDADWLVLSQESGSVAVDTNAITVTIDRTGLTPGEYTASISVTSNGGDETVSVDMVVPTVPLILVDPLSLDFDSTQSELTFEISNSGTGSVSYTLSDDADWLVLSQESGSVAVDTNTITVTIDRTGLTPGDYTASISVTSNGGDETVSVDMVVPTVPVVLVEPLSLDFDSTLTELTFEISNSGTGTVSFNLVDDADWLVLSQESGSVAVDTNAITITIDRTGLTPGDYTASVSVTSNGGDETVSVDMVVPTEPVILVDPLSLDFDSTLTELTFEISNSGTGSVSYTLSDDADWLVLSQESGSVAVDTNTITVTIDRTGLPPGDYTASVSVTSNGGDETVSIDMVVPVVPLLGITPPTLDLDTALTADSFYVFNAGFGKLTFSTQEDVAWLVAQPSSGTLTTDSAVIQVTIDRINLAPGPYTGDVVIVSDGGEDTVVVSMAVPTNPVLAVDPTALDFDSTQTGLTFDIFNSGTGTVSFEIFKTDDWISLSETTGSVTSDVATITVTVDRDLLTPGDHSSEIQVTDGVDSITVTVDLVVIEP
jgi:phage-related protein